MLADTYIQDTTISSHQPPLPCHRYPCQDMDHLDYTSDGAWYSRSEYLRQSLI